MAQLAAGSPARRRRRASTTAYDKPHGYNFLVPAGADSTVPAVPFKAMGRFAHEASVADDRGVVYQTEDSGNNSGFYRFIPNDPRNLLAGGSLQMLAVTGNPTATLFTGQRVGVRLPVSWVPIPVPDPNLEGGAHVVLRARAAPPAARRSTAWKASSAARTAARCTSSRRAAAPSGARNHQRLRPALALRARGRPLPGEDQLVLVFESPSGSVLESPDNLCLTPNGGVLFCEDDAIGDDDTHPLAPGITNVNRLIGLGPKGEPFTFAVNMLNDSEFAGACFSADGEILFVNLFGDGAPGSGMTCAIWGPWERGPL